MAGTEKTGYLSGFAHLFENAYYILTPSKSSTEDSINFMSGLVEGIGAIPIRLDADEHDKITGSISHVPHIIASSLVNLVRSHSSIVVERPRLYNTGFLERPISLRR